MSSPHPESAGPNVISVRPRLDYRYDVIQSRRPQFLGVREDLAEALVLAEWAARLHPPARIQVFGKDAGRVEETREVPGGAEAPAL